MKKPADHQAGRLGVSAGAGTPCALKIVLVDQETDDQDHGDRQHHDGFQAIAELTLFIGMGGVIRVFNPKIHAHDTYLRLGSSVQGSLPTGPHSASGYGAVQPSFCQRLPGLLTLAYIGVIGWIMRPATGYFAPQAAPMLALQPKGIAQLHAQLGLSTVVLLPSTVR